jgi:hypothetical protein
MMELEHIDKNNVSIYIYIFLYIKANVCVSVCLSVCMFKINSLIP